MSEIVSVNGLLQSMSQYMKIGDSIIFHQAPQAGAVISILTEEQRLDYEGDGSTCVFSWPQSDRSQYKHFMEEVYKYKDNPTVKDQLEKLKIVMELVR
jgi:hypothetical protein